MRYLVVEGGYYCIIVRPTKCKTDLGQGAAGRTSLAKKQNKNVIKLSLTFYNTRLKYLLYLKILK